METEYKKPFFDSGLIQNPWSNVVPNVVNDDFAVSSEWFEDVAQPHDPQDDQRAARYQDDSNHYILENFATPAIGGESIEVARFTVPRGCVGFIYGLNTFLKRGVTVYGGDPKNPFDWNVQFPNTVINWQLRIETQRQVILENIVRWPFLSIPGVPLPGFAGWNDNRFAFGIGYSRLRLLVNEAKEVRLYAQMGTPLSLVEDLPDEIGGRIVGLVQSINDNKQAIEACRSAW